MRLVADTGSWETGPQIAPPPAAAVLELSGAVLAWTVDDPAGSAGVRMAFTKPEAAEWLWRVIGETGHVALLAALDGRVARPGDVVDLPGVELAPEALRPLHRLALGHWMRRWWPTSTRDGIVGLDPVLLDAELALLTSAVQDYFTEDTLDSDVESLLEPRLPALSMRVRDPDPRVAELAGACSALADDLGLALPDFELVSVQGEGRRDDYALAAGSDRTRATTEPIASGVGSVDWAAVPPGLFDAADSTIDWAIEVTGPAAVAAVRVATHEPVAGIEVRLRSGAVHGVGVLDSEGRATLPLLGATQAPVTQAQAWAHDWPATTVTVGADAEPLADAAVVRDRLRAFARRRLAQPSGDAFLAELLAAESDY